MIERSQAWIAKFAAGGLTTLIAFGIGTLCWTWSCLAPLDRAFFDLQTRWLERAVATDLVIIEMDARSLKELGTWPWRRSRHAELISKLQNLGARRLFIDIDFSAPSAFAEDDTQLALALQRAQGTIVLPAFWQSLSSQEDALTLSEPLPALRRRRMRRAYRAHCPQVENIPDADSR